jgi:hypothetical protein
MDLSLFAVNDFSQLSNPSSRTMAHVFIQPLAKMNTKSSFLGVKRRDLQPNRHL